MKITTLIENLVYKRSLHAEHGLALYVESGSAKLLFDTGQSAMFLENAKILGIPVEDIDCLVLSHGHYDHTGGLYEFLQKNTKARVYAKRDLFKSKYHGNKEFIGTPFREENLKNRLTFIDEVTEVAENIFIMPNIHICHEVDTHFNGFYKLDEGQFVSDDFSDELFLALRHKGQVSIMTSCSHRGITNICTTATDFFQLPVDLVLGGFHINDSTVEQYVHVTHYFRQLHPKRIGACHCTGIEKFAQLYHGCETHVFYNATGTQVAL